MPSTGDSPTAERGRDVASGLQGHLEFLAHDLLEGRGTGTRGYELAAQYAASELRAAGARPSGDDDTFLQNVPFRRSQVTSSVLTMTHAGKKRTLAPTDEYLALPSALDADRTVKGDVVFVGFGTVSTEFGIDDYKDLDVKGKIVLVLLGAQAQLPSEPRAHYTSVREKLKAAFDRGAVAVIGMHSIQLETIFPYEAMKHALKEPRLTWMRDATTPFVDPPGAGPLAIVSLKTAAALLATAGLDLETIRAAGNANPSTVKGTPLPVSLELKVKSEHGQIASPNVVGVIPGTDATLRDEHVVISAHLDHLGIGRPVDGDSIYNGALDNGTGSAMVLELAHYFGANPARRSIVLLLVTGEEKGLLGSDYFARKPSVAGRLIANMNLDLVFWTKDTRKLVFFGEKTSTLGALAREAATRSGFEVIDDPMPEQAIFIRSDHYSFVKQGVPAVFLGTGFDNDGAAGRLYREKHYHKPSDQMSAVQADSAITIDYKMGARLVGMVSEVLTTVANNDGVPTWTPGNFFTGLYALK